MTPVRIGYLPLLDAVPLLVARNFGFAAGQGLELELCADVSWANLRDKLLVGHYDAAHLLAPAAIAASLGIGQTRLPLKVPFVLSFNGNAITLSTKLAAALQRENPAALDTPLAAAIALGNVIKTRPEPLTFASVFAFSNHTFLLHEFLRLGGIDPLKSVKMLVLPPSSMVSALENGDIDGFCAGSPWNSLAVNHGSGVIVALGNELLPDCAEKVLALPQTSRLFTDGTAQKLALCLSKTANWLKNPNNLPQVAALLAADPHFGWPEKMSLDLLHGRVTLDAAGSQRHSENFINFGGGDANQPRVAQARWIVERMVQVGHCADDPALFTRAEEVFSPD